MNKADKHKEKMEKLTVKTEAKALRTARRNFSRLTENEIAQIIIGCAGKVHKLLGSGLSKSAYQECMGFVLNRTVLEIERRKMLPIMHKDVEPDGAFMVDFIANKKVILEIKAMDGPDDCLHAKMQTCLRHSGCKAGLIIDFNVDQLTNGIKRVINNNYRCRSLRIAPHN